LSGRSVAGISKDDDNDVGKIYAERQLAWGRGLAGELEAQE